MSVYLWLLLCSVIETSATNQQRIHAFKDASARNLLPFDCLIARLSKLLLKRSSAMNLLIFLPSVLIRQPLCLPFNVASSSYSHEGGQTMKALAICDSL